MKKRLSSLDGLRGFAALAVLFSHSGFKIDSIINVSFLTFLYKTFAVGPNSVQILFVLSGFLMAYLYPQMRNPVHFIQKRYARIIPIYVLVVFFISELNGKGRSWEQDVIQLLAVAFIVFFVWKILERINLASLVGKVLFFIYIGLQIGMLLINVFVAPHFIQFGTINLPEFYKHLLIVLSNITLTTPFVNGVPRLSGVFWSLAPEIYFYLIYPFFIIPLIHTGKKWGIWVTILISFSMIKILFDLDGAFVGLGSLLSLSFARTCGFLTGVIVGSVYEQKGKLWKWIENLGKKPLSQILVMIAFCAIQWGDWAVRDGQSIYFMNVYYLLSSVVIAMLILMIIIPNSISNRVFSSKLLVFFGLISYSMYLIHPQTVDWARRSIPTAFQTIGISFPIVLLLLTAIVSYVLFRCIESLYFRSKKSVTVISGKKENNQAAIFVYPPKTMGILAVISVLFFISIYSEGYSPSFLLSRHIIPNYSPLHFETSILKKSLRIPITGAFDNLSAIVIDLRYFQNAEATRTRFKNPSTLTFRLLNAQTGKKIFESERSSFDVEGTPRYPLGITTIGDSKGKRYIVELELKNGKQNDQVFINTSPTSLVSIYTTNKKTLLRNPLPFIGNRLLFVFSHQGMMFALFFIILSTYLYIRKK